MNSLKKLFSTRNILAFLLAGIVLSVPGMTFAQTFGDSDVLQGLAKILGLVIQVFTFIALWMMSFFGKLLGTDLLTGPEAIQAVTPMWVWVRNLTNILFVVVLVGLAFTNLYSSFSKEGGGNWTIKEKLPKVIIALVAINFSLLGFKVVIDAVNVGTVAILGIADSRLDVDNPDQQSTMIASKTWVKVKKSVYDSFKNNPQYDGEVKNGQSCTAEHNQAELTTGQVLVKEDNLKYYVCRNFRSQINDMFCPEWEEKVKDGSGKEKDVTTDELGDGCFFLLKAEGFKSILSPSDEPGQNLFMAFGTTFIHLERMPALAASINSLEGVLINALFSAILGIAYLVALVAIFIALIARVVVIWLALTFSPILIAAAIMGFDEKIGEASKYLVTYLIMPLKIAAAFAVSFVMMSAMIDFNVEGGDTSGAFVFGPSLSQLGTIGSGYGLIWQIATIVIFWMAAKWAVKDTGGMVQGITDKIFTGAESLGKFAAESATINRPLFSVGTGEKGEKLSISNLFSAPLQAAQLKLNGNEERTRMLAIKMAGLEEESAFAKGLPSHDWKSIAPASLAPELKGFENEAELNRHKDDLIKAWEKIPEFKELAEKLKTESGSASDILHKEFSNNKGKYGYDGNMTEDSWYDGKTKTPAEGGKGNGKGNESSSKSDNIESTNEGGAKMVNKGDRNEWKIFKQLSEAKRDITNGGYSTNTSGVKKFADDQYSGDMIGAAAQLKIAGVEIAGIKAADLTIASTKTDGSSNIVFQEKNKDGVQAVYIADRKNGAPIDLTTFGAANLGKVEKTEVNAVIENISKETDNKKFEKIGMTKKELLIELKKIEGAKESTSTDNATEKTET